MNHLPLRLHPITSLLLALTTVAGSLAASPQPDRSNLPALPASTAGTGADSQPSTPAAAPVFQDCSGGTTLACANLQVLLLIDDSSSMLYTDPTRQRLVGVKNVLDILAREYYLPAVDANSRDPGIQVPKIQVALIHFSTEVLYDSGWKTINPASLAGWDDQLKTFDADLSIKIDYTKAQATDYIPAFQAAARLASGQSQTPGCPRLVMLFTDGTPDMGSGPLLEDKLTEYMGRLQGIIQPTFNRSNDLVYVTAFVSGSYLTNAWNSIYQPKWEAIVSKGSDRADPPQVLNVPTQELAARMERIIGSTIGDPVYNLTPAAGQPKQYSTEIPSMVESLRLTYYTLNTSSSFTVTGPDGSLIQQDGKNVSLDGANTTIQVLEILNPAPGSYLVTTSAPGGTFTRLLRFKKVSAKLSQPVNAWLQFTRGQIGIQLSGADGLPLAIPSQVSIQAALTQAGKPSILALTPGSDSFTTSWMPLSKDKASVDACVTLKDSQGKVAVLYNGPVGEINIDTLSVQAGQAAQVCANSGKDIRLPLQLINDRSQQPAAIDMPVMWSSSPITSPGEAKFDTAIREVDAKSGQYVLSFKPVSGGDRQFAVTASAMVDGVIHTFYEGTVSSTGPQDPRPLALTLENRVAPVDRLSVLLYRTFHPCCIDNTTQIAYGRHFFGLFGPAQVQVGGRFMDTGRNAGEPGIERFAVQLVSPTGGRPSETRSDWATPAIGGGPSTLELASPGLGMYTITVSDQGQNPACSVLGSLPSQKILLINDFWEYLAILALILLLVLLVFWLVRRYRDRHWGHEIPLILLSIVLIVLDVILVNSLVTQTFKCELNCAHLAGPTFSKLCTGIATDSYHVLGPYELDGFHIPAIDILFIHIPAIDVGPLRIPSVDIPSIQILPALGAVIDPPLEIIRRIIAWSIVLAFGVVSLVLGRIIIKIKGFIQLLQTPDGRRLVLTNVSIFLFFFVIFCSLFFLWPGR